MKSPNQARGDYLLTYWAKWARARAGSGLWYPSESIECKIMKEGTIIQGNSGGNEPENAIAEKVESIIVRMPANMREVTKIEYLMYGPRGLKQKIVHLGRRTYESLLRRSQEWIAMEADENCHQ